MLPSAVCSGPERFEICTSEVTPVSFDTIAIGEFRVTVTEPVSPAAVNAALIAVCKSVIRSLIVSPPEV